MPSISGPEAESGRTLGHYRLLEPIGTGGMGVVYRARDERLERDVAIKVLPRGRLPDETARRRFRTEALALSRLNHPNIATIHDFDTDAGIDFLVMEYIPGASLDARVREGGLSDAEVRHIGVQLAHGLRAAHERGVIHGDLKPANLRLTLDGRLKILDFGLARLLQSVSVDEADRTRTMEVAGTLPYMAPERFHGGGIDIRTDIYAVGAVLYELASGRRLFGDARGAELLNAILREEPDAPRACNRGISEPLDAVIRTALAKDPMQRQQSADQLLRDLERLQSYTVQSQPRGLRRRLRLIGLASAVLALVATAYVLSRNGGISPTSPARITIAVLPFHTTAVTEPLRFLGVGIPDAIITRLAIVQQLAPRPTSAILRYENQPIEPREVGRILTSDYLVTGILQEAGDRLRISVQLVRARDGAPLWGNHYNVARSDLLGLQDQVAQAVADALQVRMSAVERTRLFRRYTDNTAAYELYLKGRAQLSRFTGNELRAAVNSFGEAIRLDPNYAPAYGGLAMACAKLRSVAPESETRAWGERAEREARTALRLEPQLAEAHEALAAVHRGVEFDWDRTLEESRLALELNPNLDHPHFYRAAAFYHLGLFDLIEPELRAAVDVNPTNQIEVLTIRGNAALFSGRFREAIPLLEDAERVTHNTVASSYLAQAFFGIGNAMHAEHLLAPLAGNTPGDRRAQAVLASLLAARRERDKAMALVRGILASKYMDHHVGYSLGATYAQLGERAEATRWLAQSARDGFRCYPWLRRDQLLDPLRSDAGYQGLLAEQRQFWEANKARYGSRATE